MAWENYASNVGRQIDLQCKLISYDTRSLLAKMLQTDNLTDEQRWVYIDVSDDSQGVFFNRDNKYETNIEIQMEQI